MLDGLAGFPDAMSAAMALVVIFELFGSLVPSIGFHVKKAYGLHWDK